MSGQFSQDDEEVKIELDGFSAKSDFGPFLKGIVLDLSRESPSSSMLTASFKKAANVTVGSIKIQSAEDVFSATAQGANSREIAVRVAQDIHSQLERWRVRRKKALADLP